MTKEEVKRFVSKYVSYYIQDEHIKSVETITRYIGYDTELIIDDIDEINKFIIDNFGINAINFGLDRLVVTKDGQEWNPLETLSDLAVLEELLGLGIVTGLIKDKFGMRIEAFLKLGGDNIYMCPELMDIQEGEEERAYMFHLKHHCLPLLHFEVERNKIPEEQKVVFTKEDKEELMLFWFNQMNQVDVDEQSKKLFETLVQDNVERVVNAAVYLRLMKQGPEGFYISMKVDPSCLFVERINQTIREYATDKREYFEDVKKVFLSDIEKIRNEFNNPFGEHKKTLR